MASHIAMLLWKYRMETMNICRSFRHRLMHFSVIIFHDTLQTYACRLRSNHRFKSRQNIGRTVLALEYLWRNSQLGNVFAIYFDFSFLRGLVGCQLSYIVISVGIDCDFVCCYCVVLLCSDSFTFLHLTLVNIDKMVSVDDLLSQLTLDEKVNFTFSATMKYEYTNMNRFHFLLGRTSGKQSISLDSAYHR
jgi:hypothetical protein